MHIICLLHVVIPNYYVIRSNCFEVLHFIITVLYVIHYTIVLIRFSMSWFLLLNFNFNLMSNMLLTLAVRVHLEEVLEVCTLSPLISAYQLSYN